MYVGRISMNQSNSILQYCYLSFSLYKSTKSYKKSKNKNWELVKNTRNLKANCIKKTTK